MSDGDAAFGAQLVSVGLLRLADPDAYGDVCPTGQIDLSPRHYRKVPKEKMVDMAGADLFKPRHPHTVGYELSGVEWDLYEAVTDFVSTELARIRGDTNRGVAGFALTTMQRRLASSVRAIKRTLERRIARLERALEDPEAYVRSLKDFVSEVYGDDPDAMADLAEEECWLLEERALEEWLPGTVDELRAELTVLHPLLTQAEQAEAAGSEIKLNELMSVLTKQGLRRDRTVKLLIFTEHKDTLDFLAETLDTEGFEVAVIHGGLKLRDRIAAERHFRDQAQIMVATEAAGEGINLQFCHLMVNYDIPWNPNRLEQRMGRIHRIGQTRDVHIYNLVAINTREGAVLATLLHKLENMARTLGESVFDVIGEIFAGTRLVELIEKVLAGEVTEQQAIEELGGETIDPQIEEKFRTLTAKALATHHLDWQAQADSAARAAERRLPPGYLERFFKDAMDFLGGTVTERLDSTLRVSRTPDQLVVASRLAGATREIFPSYERLTFDRAVALGPAATSTGTGVPEAELCGPGHPLFDAALKTIVDQTSADVDAGAAFSAPDIAIPTVVHFVVGDTIDGNNEVVHRAFATITEPLGGVLASERVLLYDLIDHTGAAPATEPASDETVAAWGPGSGLRERARYVHPPPRDPPAQELADFGCTSAEELLLLTGNNNHLLGVSGETPNARRGLAKSKAQEWLPRWIGQLDTGHQSRLGAILDRRHPPQWRHDDADPSLTPIVVAKRSDDPPRCAITSSIAVEDLRRLLVGQPWPERDLKASANRFSARCGNDPTPLWVDNYLSDTSLLDFTKLVEFLEMILSNLPRVAYIRVLSRNWVDGRRVYASDILTALQQAGISQEHKNRLHWRLYDQRNNVNLHRRELILSTRRAAFSLPPARIVIGQDLASTPYGI